MIDFTHKQAAHCETGAISGLFRFHGLEVSEPMAFGLASGLTFAYLPMVKINGLPLLAYRMPPRMILKMLGWRIKGLDIQFKTFKNEQQGSMFLNQKLSEGQLVGLQTSVYFLPYFPKEMRFHFNAHNLLVYGQFEQDNMTHYHISDPIFDKVVTVDQASLNKARFAKGALAPNGRLYYFSKVPTEIDFEKLIPKALHFTAKVNGKGNPAFIAGVAGMRLVAKRIEKLSNETKRYQQLFLGHIVRMQEEIGTGGAGFRFMYAAFLQESAEKLNRPELKEWATELIEIGDEWREFALRCARINKNRGDHSLQETADYLRKLAAQEQAFYQKMRQF